MANGPVEPSADIRTAANSIRQIYLALIQEDFDERQALTIVGQILASNGGGA